ncbi:MAG: tryptophan synthase subunit alpha [FCB group bacterium]|nr:tryptophan synthase subunit alpha [FCB group bacterium]
MSTEQTPVKKKDVTGTSPGNRIQALFRTPGEKLIPFITAGYPTKELTVELVLAAERAGADMIELGMPFSDPLAEGPVIQASSQIALENGVTLKWILDQVRIIRRRCEMPLALMGYINPILQYGVETFVKDCRSAGVDGLIIPDLPPEEAEPLIGQCRKNSVSPILLVAPNTSDERIHTVSGLAGDLIYCVSILGITGSDLTSVNTLENYLERVRKHSVTPFVVGFGIKTREDVRNINRMADGAVVGSELIRRITKTDDPVEAAETYIRRLKGGDEKT